MKFNYIFYVLFNFYLIMFLQNIEKFIFDDINYVDSDYFYLRIYR